MNDAYHTRVLKRPVDLDGSTAVAVAIEVYAAQRDAMWEQLIWHALNMERLLETFPGLWVTRYVLTARGKRLELSKLVEQELEKRSTAKLAAQTSGSATGGSRLLPPNMDWYVRKQWRQVCAIGNSASASISQGLNPMEVIVTQIKACMDEAHQGRRVQIQGDLTQVKVDIVSRMDANKVAPMTVSAGDDNRRLYPALWTLEYQTSATIKINTVILKIRSDLSGKCYHDPLEITVGDTFVAQYGPYLQAGLSLFATAIPNFFGKGIFDAIASECTKQMDRAITLRNIVHGLDLAAYGATTMETTRTLLPDEALVMFRALLLVYDPKFEPLRMPQISKLECGIVRDTGEYVWAHRSEIEGRAGFIRLKHDCWTSSSEEKLPPITKTAPQTILGLRGKANGSRRSFILPPVNAAARRASSKTIGAVVCDHVMLTIVEMRNLRNMRVIRLIGKQSPYCEWRLLVASEDNTIASGSTAKHIGGGCSPNWSDQQFRIDMSKSAATSKGFLLLLQVKCVGIVPMVKTTVSSCQVELSGAELQEAVSSGELIQRELALFTGRNEPAGQLLIQLQIN